MPILVQADIRELDQEAFGEIAYQVLGHAFAIHKKMGRFFNEDIYRDAVAAGVGSESITPIQTLDVTTTLPPGTYTQSQVHTCREKAIWLSTRLLSLVAG